MRSRLALFAFCLVLFFAFFVGIIDLLLRDTIRAWAESRAVNIATRAISQAVSMGVAPQIDAASLVIPVLDETGRLAGFHYRMGEINRIEAEAADWIQRQLHALAEHALPVPVGQLLGVDWLAGLGPAIPVRIVPTGHVRAAPKSEFRAAGINQVLHRIYMDVEVKMMVVAPLIKHHFPVSQQIVLSERVIVGEVPDFFVQWGRGDLHDLTGGALIAPLRSEQRGEPVPAR